jgi:hypothetical protein
MRANSQPMRRDLRFVSWMSSGGRSSHRSSTTFCAGTVRSRHSRATMSTTSGAAPTAAPRAGASCSTRGPSSTRGQAGRASPGRLPPRRLSCERTTVALCAAPRWFVGTAADTSATSLQTVLARLVSAIASTRPLSRPSPYRLRIRARTGPVCQAADAPTTRARHARGALVPTRAAGSMTTVINRIELRRVQWGGVASIMPCHSHLRPPLRPRYRLGYGHSPREVLVPAERDVPYADQPSRRPSARGAS